MRQRLLRLSRFLLLLPLFAFLAPGETQGKGQGRYKCPSVCGGGYNSCYFHCDPPPMCDPSKAEYWNHKKSKPNVFTDPCSPGSKNYWVMTMDCKPKVDVTDGYDGKFLRP